MSTPLESDAMNRDDANAGGIELQAVSKRYGGAGAPLVVVSISVRVPRGTLTTLLGPSGCGKTTTLRMIAGLEVPTSGRIVIAGRDVTDLPAAERDVSMVFQSYALFPHMNVLANVAYGLGVAGVARAEARERARAAMATVGLVGLDERLPSELSGGQQQRVALARALVLEPAVLLFDEPLSNLDARLRRSMREEIRSLQQRLGLTVAYVTHDQEEAMALSDRIVVMNHGRAEQVGPPHEAYERPATPFVAGFLGKTNLVKGTTVRPERISFATSGLAGTVKTRIFQGNHWLYQVDTADGLVTVIRQNTGEVMPEEGAAVHLSFVRGSHVPQP
jgi:ABC-type Fe3+/spermidine/putrescine transport system ATPase subunit